jgi:hypothetical protein
MKTSFGQMNKAELIAVAERFEVDITACTTNKEIENKIIDAGITWAAYRKFVAEVEEANQPQENTSDLFVDSTVLLKMDRQNPTFEAYGHMFTKKHPFAVMAAEDAQRIIDNFEGFRIASPAEAKSFYG